MQEIINNSASLEDLEPLLARTKKNPEVFSNNRRELLANPQLLILYLSLLLSLLVLDGSSKVSAQATILDQDQTLAEVLGDATVDEADLSTEQAAHRIFFPLILRDARTIPLLTVLTVPTLTTAADVNTPDCTISVRPLGLAASDTSQNQCLAPGVSYFMSEIAGKQIIFQQDGSAASAFQVNGELPAQTEVLGHDFTVSESALKGFEIIGPNFLKVEETTEAYTFAFPKDEVLAAQGYWNILEQLRWLRTYAHWSRNHQAGFGQNFPGSTPMMHDLTRDTSTPAIECTPSGHTGPYRGVFNGVFKTGFSGPFSFNVWTYVGWQDSTLQCMDGALGYVWLNAAKLTAPEFKTFMDSVDTTPTPEWYQVTLPEPLATLNEHEIDTLGWIIATGATLRLVWGYMENGVFMPVGGALLMMPNWEMICEVAPPEGYFPECLSDPIDTQ